MLGYGGRRTSFQSQGNNLVDPGDDAIAPPSSKRRSSAPAVRSPPGDGERLPLHQPVEEEESRGRIFNSLSTPRRKEEAEEEPVVEKKPAPEPVRDPEPAPSKINTEPRPVDPMDEEDEEDWGAVPAFLRRSKLK